MADDPLRSFVENLIAGDLEGRSAVSEALAAFEHAVRAAEPAPIDPGAVSARLAEGIRRHVTDSTIRGKLLHAAGQMTMGLARQRPDRLPTAVALHRQALEELPRDRVPHLWAVAQIGLGNALSRLGEMTGEPAPLEEAERALRSALEELHRDRTPREWAMANANLGDALRVLAEFMGEPARLEEAELALRSALGALPHQAPAEDRATVQMNLGNTLLRLGEATGEPARVADAVAAYRSGLKKRPRGRFCQLSRQT